MLCFATSSIVYSFSGIVNAAGLFGLLTFPGSDESPVWLMTGAAEVCELPTIDPSWLSHSTEIFPGCEDRV